MKFVNTYFFGLLLILSLQSCLRDECTSTKEFLRYDPVRMHVNEFRKEITTEASFKLENPGKIYFYNNYLLVNEMGRGIHFFDVSDSKNPVEKIFYNIPGNFDMAVKNDILMVDNVIDLVSINISDVLNPKTVSRIENYRNEYTPVDNMYTAYNIVTKVTNIVDCSNENFNNNWFIEDGIIFAESGSSSVLESTNSIKKSGSINQVGVGGSFAKFTVYDDYLYTVKSSGLNTYKINSGMLEFRAESNMGWGIETIFPYKDKLFIGSNTGMFIFDNSSPEHPSLLSSFDHAGACDPVFVNGNTAYVTLRNGNQCRGFVNQMDVIDITSLTDPKLIKSYPMKNPHGLAIHNNTIYLCEGQFGLKTLNAEEPNSIKELGFDTSVKSYDAIVLGDDRLFVIGEDGFYQYNVSDPKHLKLLSQIQVQK